jgi:hypothetical protein
VNEKSDGLFELIESKTFFSATATTCSHRRNFPGIENQTAFMRLVLLIALVLVSAASAPAVAASYVYCDNGLRCFKAPCPSSNALNLATGTVAKGVSIDTERLPAKDRTGDLPNDLYAGKLVLKGFVEKRSVTYTGKKYRLPYLVATRVERTATPAESRRCRGR